MANHSYQEAKRATLSGNWELLLSGYAFHGSSYTAEQMKHINELPWGLGVGRCVEDERKNLHEVYAIAFRDSHFQMEYHVGYRWMHPCYTITPELRLEAGYTLFLFMREDVGNYFPLPGALPVVGLGGKHLKLNATYIPKLGSTFQGDTLYLYLTAGW